MSLLYVYDPALVSKEPPVLELLIGGGDSDSVNEGDADFVKQLLHDIGIEVPAAKWSITPCRATYYSEYPDTGEWEDRWPVGWLTRVELQAIPMRMPLAQEGIVGTDAIDMTFSYENHQANLERVHCLVIADFENEVQLKKAREKIEDEAKNASPAPVISVGEALGRYPQLRVDLGERDRAFFEARVPHALHIADTCRSYGASLSHSETVKRAGL